MDQVRLFKCLIEKLAKAALVQQDPEDLLRRILTLKNLNGGTAYVVEEPQRRFDRAMGVAGEKRLR